MSPGHPFSWHDLLRYGHPWIYLLKWPIYFAAGWGAIYYRRWRKNRDENIAQGWPSVEGLIISGKVTPIPKTKQFHVALQYTYFVGEYRSGKYLHDFPSESEADDFVRQMKDKRVQIRYNQSNPDKSVLEQSVIEQHVMLAPRFG
jgi:Protein of unknown function (DUF3592)